MHQGTLAATEAESSSSKAGPEFEEAENTALISDRPASTSLLSLQGDASTSRKAPQNLVLTIQVIEALKKFYYIM